VGTGCSIHISHSPSVKVTDSLTDPSSASTLSGAAAELESR
jgi:hypothetical protein